MTPVILSHATPTGIGVNIALSPHFWMGNITRATPQRGTGSTVTRSAHWVISGQFDCYYRMEKYLLIGHEVSDRQLKDQIRDGLRDIYRH